MPIREISRSIAGSDDFELAIPRRSPLPYHATVPGDGRAGGLLFLIPAAGDDPTSEAMRALRLDIARDYNLVAVSVEYHCLRSMIRDGAQFDLTDEELASLQGLCASHGVALLDRSALIQSLKQLPVAYEFEFRVALRNGDYQNLGLMQALDHLAVLQDIYGGQAGVSCEERRVIAMGAGYGGYLAHLLGKVAPNTVGTVIDVGGPTGAPEGYLFGSAVSEQAPYYYHAGKVRIFPLVETRWSRDSTSPFHYNSARRMMRNTALAGHIAAMRDQAGEPAKYHLVEPTPEQSEPGKRKLAQAQLLEGAGFPVKLEWLGPGYESSDDSTAILNHVLQQRYLDDAVRAGPMDPQLGSSVAYLCDSLIYSFDHGSWGCQASCHATEPQRARYYLPN